MIGWGLMFGNGNPFMGLEGLFFVNAPHHSSRRSGRPTKAPIPPQLDGVPLWAMFFFQLVFAGTAATIRIGAVPPETHQVSSFILLTRFILVGIMYPHYRSLIWWAGAGSHRSASSTSPDRPWSIRCGGWSALLVVLLSRPAALGK